MIRANNSKKSSGIIHYLGNFVSYLKKIINIIYNEKYIILQHIMKN